MRSYIFLLLLLTTQIFATDNFLDGVFINPVDKHFSLEIDAKNDEYPIKERFIDDIIEVVSGMIYGWEFSYTPSDIKREIKEIFTLEPIAKIKKGDPGMRFRDNWIVNRVMYQNIVYHLNDYQKHRISSWHSTVNLTSTGQGEASTLLLDSKSQSLKTAIKDSIKKEFQSRGKDKPRLIEGQLILQENPRIFIKAGYVRTHVKVIILYKKVNKFRYK